MTKNTLKTITILGLSLVASSSFAAASLPANTVCATDAKMCPDGTSVSRKGPNCQFEACPSEVTNKNKKGKKDDVKDINICTKEYDPVCALVDTGIRCIKAPCPSSVEKTFSNDCMAKNARAKFLHKGVCQSSKEEDFSEGVPDGKSEGASETDSQLAEKQKVLNPEDARKEEEKVKLFVLLEQAKSEDERKKILHDSKMMKLAASDTNPGETIILENKTKPENKILEKRKEILEKKSKEIFSKFDFFVAKLEAVAKKISDKNKIVKNPQVAEILASSKKTLSEANKLKTKAWIVFSEIAEVETKEAAKEKITEVKKLLLESKKKISISFASVKQALGFLKK